MTTAETLDERLEAFDRDRSYTTERLLKENELERTEVVRDAQGRRFIRKYISVDEGQVHPYEWVRNVRNPYLQTVHETMRLGDKVVVVCEYVEGVNLREFVNTFGVLGLDSACKYLQNICDALSVLHAMSTGPIIHRDVHPGNIIITNGKAVLVDLGISRMRREGASKDTHIWGTEGYAAPEQFGFRQTDARTDIYSLGQCLRFMTTGCEPGDNNANMTQAVAQVVYKATRIDPSDRYANVGELSAALQRMREGDLEPDRSEQDRSDDVRQAVRDAQEQDYWANVARNAYSPHGHAPLEPKAKWPGSGMVGATKRSKVVLVLFRIWQFYAVVYSVAFLVIPFVPTFSSQPIGMRISTALVCWFGGIIPMVMSANLGHINDRLPWLRENRYVRMVLMWFAIYFAIGIAELVMLAMGVPLFTTNATAGQ